MAESDDGPTGRERWERRLDELYALAIARTSTWAQRVGGGGEPLLVTNPYPDIKGGVEVVRLALQLHDALPVGNHGITCKCNKCKQEIATAEAAVTRRLRKVAG